MNRCLSIGKFYINKHNNKPFKVIGDAFTLKMVGATITDRVYTYDVVYDDGTNNTLSWSDCVLNDNGSPKEIN